MVSSGKKICCRLFLTAKRNSSQFMSSTWKRMNYRIGETTKSTNRRERTVIRIRRRFYFLEISRLVRCKYVFLYKTANS